MGRDKPMKHKYKTGKEASKPKTSISPRTVIPPNPIPSHVHTTIDAERSREKSAAPDLRAHTSTSQAVSEGSSPPSSETVSLDMQELKISDQTVDLPQSPLLENRQEGPSPRLLVTSSDLMVVGQPVRYEPDDDDDMYARTIHRVPRQE